MLLFGALSLKIVKLEEVKQTGTFLTTILPLLFVAPVVNLLDCWPVVRTAWIPLVGISIVSTVLVFGVAGVVTQLVMKRGGKKHD